MDQRGMPLRIATIWQMASLLAMQRPGSQPVGERWAYNFVKRHNELQSKWNRKYDYKRALCEGPTLIRNWFKRVQDIKIQYGILDEDVWNFDETSFQMGVRLRAVTFCGRTTPSGSSRPARKLLAVCMLFIAFIF
jgi:hypothetical protein